MDLKKLCAEAESYIIDLRRWFHRHPEVSCKEFTVPSEVLLGHNDHRIVMALAVLCSITGGIIDGAEAVAKSFPYFFQRFRSLGIEACEI